MVLSGPACLCGNYGSPLEQGLLDEATDLPACDYDENPTPLYTAMEAHQWAAVSRFLKTGVWPGNFFSDTQTPKQQVRTWVFRYDDSRHEMHELSDGPDLAAYHHNFLKSDTVSQVSPPPPQSSNRHMGRYLRWRQLPLHAALIFLAPPLIVKQLIEAFPYALRCPDNNGMLPLHLAFRQAVPDDILTILLRLFPNGMHVRDRKGRLPVECVRVDLMNQEGGAPPLRGMIIQSIMQQSKDKFSKQQEDIIQNFQKEIENLTSKMATLEHHLNSMDQRERTTRQELSSTLEQLNTLKRNHRKLQEMQRFSIQRQVEQETMEKQTQNFQQRLLEQLDLAEIPLARSLRRSTSRGRSNSRGRATDDPRRDRSQTPRDRAPSPVPSLGIHREGSGGYRSGRTQRQHSQMSYSQDEEDAYPETPSYSSGVSRFTDATKGGLNASTVATAVSAFDGKSAHRRGEMPSLFRSPSYATTNATATTFQTQAQLRSEGADEEGSNVNVLPLHDYQSIMDRRRSIARAVYPVGTASKNTREKFSNRKQNSPGGPQKAAQALETQPTTSTCGVVDSPKWDFSFTPAFLKPLSINDL